MAEWGKKNTPERDWKQDFKIGDRVVATCDIPYSEISRVYVARGTQGVVRKIGTHDHFWGIRWGTRRDIWYCVFDLDDVWLVNHDFKEVEFVPLRWWERRHLDTLEEVMIEPEPPINDPAMYARPLL